MDFGQLVSSAWGITWRGRGLWIVGLFAGSASGTCQGFTYQYPGTQPGPTGTGPGAGTSPDLQQGLPDLNQILRQAEVQQALAALQQALPILIGAVLAVLVISLLFWLLSVACKAAVIAGGGSAAGGTPISLGVAWQVGNRAFGRLIGLELLWLLLWWVVVGVILIGVIGTVRSQPLDRVNWLGLLSGVGGILVLIAIAASVLSVVLAFAQRAIVLDQAGTLAGVRHGFGVVRGAIGNTLILWLISAALGIGGGIALVIALLVAAIPGLIVGGILAAIVNAAGGPGLAALIIVCGLVVLVAAFVGSAILNTFLWNYWTLGYLRLTQPPVVVAAPVPAPEPLSS